MKQTTFRYSDRKGTLGQEVVTKWLIEEYYCVEYSGHHDVSKIKKYQDIDVDLLLFLEQGTEEIEKLEEIKTECVTSKNLFYEWISDEKYNTLGCMRKTKSDDIYFYYPLIDNKLYQFDRREFVKWAEPKIFKGDFGKPKRTQTTDERTGKTKTTVGYVIPRKELEEQGFCKVFTIDDNGVFDFLRKK